MYWGNALLITSRVGVGNLNRWRTCTVHHGPSFTRTFCLFISKGWCRMFDNLWFNPQDWKMTFLMTLREQRLFQQQFCVFLGSIINILIWNLSTIRQSEPFGILVRGKKHLVKIGSTLFQKPPPGVMKIKRKKLNEELATRPPVQSAQCPCVFAVTPGWMGCSNSCVPSCIFLFNSILPPVPH